MMSIIKRCKILRLSAPGKLISADNFERLFSTHCQNWADISFEDPATWLERIGIGTSPTVLQDARRTFQQAAKHYRFISPGFKAFHLLPLICGLRGSDGPDILFIAHAPAQHVNELALVRNCLHPGDVIICPSRNAQEIICTLSSDFEPYCHIIPHFISSDSAPTPKTIDEPQTGVRRLVTLSRITPDKLIHRQIDAMSLLVDQGNRDLVMEIAGPGCDEFDRPTPYLLELESRIKRLNLVDRVFLKTPVQSTEAKWAFLHGAVAAVQLSRAEEESFSKSCAEAITAGIPVVATRWDGIPETVGACGELIDLKRHRDRYVFDVDPGDCARAIANVLASVPGTEQFARQRRVFESTARSEDYRNLQDVQPSERESGESVDSKRTDLFSIVPAVQAVSSSYRMQCYLASLKIRLHQEMTHQESARLLADHELLSELTYHSCRARMRLVLAHDQVQPPASAVLTNKKPIPYPRNDAHVGPLVTSLLEAALRPCDRWAREVTINLLSARFPEIADWGYAVLSADVSSSGSLLLAAINRETAAQRHDSAVTIISDVLRREQLTENDGERLFYYWTACSKAKNLSLLGPLFKQWLQRYPDAPGSGRVWLALAHLKIILEEDLPAGRFALERAERILVEVRNGELAQALAAKELS